MKVNWESIHMHLNFNWLWEHQSLADMSVNMVELI